MTPDFRVTADSKNITEAIRSRLLELRVRDEAGLDSDTCEIRLDDRAPHIALPRTGAKLEVHLGYRQTGLVAMGKWTVDEAGVSGPPATLNLRARAADLLAAIKSPRERSWPDGTTLGALVTTIAGAHDLVPAVSATLAGIVLPHIDQTESDLNLLTRLARDHDAVAKAAGGRLLFCPRGEAKSAGGTPLARIELTWTDLGTYEAVYTERGKYSAVIAHWQDVQGGERIPVKAGAGEPELTLRRTYPDEATAWAAAKSRLSALERGAATLRLSCRGNVRLMAEARLVISDVRPGVDGEWSVVRVEHVYNGQGYHCEVEAETPKEDAS
ncbi:phage late control D family protein [Desulfobulbus elongatus]|uniref:phage late control D family protein n=1 Tax=Desulfobulbus elongatus TaxID=53332 RepID=UPI0005563319|nr:contractile injection system protein, VgrG/Pvc8 family [Desulfobulbus elongatus]